MRRSQKAGEAKGGSGNTVSQGKESVFSVQWEPKLRFESYFQKITQIAVWEMNSSQAREETDQLESCGDS